MNVLNKETLRSLHIPALQVQPCSTSFVGPCSERLHVVGRIEGIPIIVGGVRVPTSFTVLRLQKKGYLALLDQPWLEAVRSVHDWDSGTLTLGLAAHRVTIGLHPQSQLAGNSRGMNVLRTLFDDEESNEGNNASDSSREEGVTDEDSSSDDWESSEEAVYSIQLVPKDVAKSDARPAETKWVEFPAGPGRAKKAQIAADLPEDIERGLTALFTEFQHLFITDHKELQQTNLREHHI